MYRLEAAMPVKVRREGRRNTTIKANIRDECLGLLSMSTKNGEGLWGAVVGGETVTIFAMRQMPALSRIVHSWALARTDRERSWEQFAHALESDVADVQGGTTAEGIHLGAMAGTVDLLQRGYAGLEARRDALWFDPALPKELVA